MTFQCPDASEPPSSCREHHTRASMIRRWCRQVRNRLGVLLDDCQGVLESRLYEKALIHLAGRVSACTTRVPSRLISRSMIKTPTRQLGGPSVSNFHNAGRDSTP